MCRAKFAYNEAHGCHCSCGVADRAKMSWQPRTTQRQRLRRVAWEPVLNERDHNLVASCCTGGSAHLTRTYGEDLALWPTIGCDSKCSPWARGAARVVELLAGPGE